MIVGVGTDMVYIPRIDAIFKRWGKGFTRRVYCCDELAYCLRHRDPAQRLALRFAAKEAFVKAIGTGISGGITWRQICVVRDKTGRPSIVLSDMAAQKAEEIGVRRCHVSLTHEHEYAHAVVILED